jgi:hypothetical protein
MGAAREKDQADFDLESFIRLFDTALTSTDPRVKNALQSLMTMVVLTQSESPNRAVGPLERLFNDVRNISRRVERLESDRYSDRPEIRRPEVPGQIVPQKVSAEFVKQFNGGSILGPENRAKGLR